VGEEELRAAAGACTGSCWRKRGRPAEEREMSEREGEESAAAAAAGDEPHEGCGSWEMDRVWTGCLSLGPFYGLDRLSLGPFYLPKSAFLPI